MNEKKLPTVAYFSMEFGLHSDFKMYAGGLGILAGDYIKGAKDINAPIVPIGLKWKQGYTDQRIDAEGKPYDTYHNYVYDFLEDTGVKVSVKVRNVDVICKVWKTDKFGNNPYIYLIQIFLRTVMPGLQVNYMAGLAKNGLLRKSCWVSVGSRLCGRYKFQLTSTISTKAMPHLQQPN